MSDFYIEISNLSKNFNEREILKNISFNFKNKGFYCLVGQSGCGKSTLLNILSGLDNDFEGSVKILGKDIKIQGSSFRLKNIGFVFQNYSCLELDNVYNNASLTLRSVSKDKISLIDSKTSDLLNFVGLKTKRKCKANTLSGGEKQRLCIARAIASKPKILLCDEPTGSLDSKNAKRIFEMLKSISREILVIVVSHDLSLVEKFADTVLFIKNHAISNEVNLENPLVKPFNTLEIKKKNKSPRLGLSFLISHSFNSLKNKKWRTLLCISTLSIGLLGLGLSTYVKDCIKGEIGNVLDGIVSKDQIVMTPKTQSSNYLNNIYSASESDIKQIKNDYSNEIKDYGVSYIADFESYFPDDNRMYVKKGSKTIVLPSFSARTANDFLWLDDYQSLNYYPSKIKPLQNDDVILGLPYSDMVNLCYGLQILRNYESLGNYIQNIGMQIILSFANYSWTYEDEQIFNVRNVVAFSKPTIFHSNHKWNEFLFEESMRFPSNDYEDKSLPWILKKVFYLETYRDISKTLKKIREDKKYSSYVFEPPSYEYESTHCEYQNLCNLKRVYVYIADKMSVPYSDILAISTLDGISSKVITTNGSYCAFPSSLLMGFFQKFYLTNSLIDAYEIVDSLSDVKKETALLNLDKKESTIDGNYLQALNGGLKISSNFKANDMRPSAIDEVVLSSSLRSKWGDTKEIYNVAQVYESENDNYIHREFRIVPLKVVGYIENQYDCLYVVDDWTIDYFRDCLGMSSFYLEPTGAIFTVENSENNDQILQKLQKLYPRYSFDNPSKDVEESISSTTDYLGVILAGASIISLSISSILFITVIVISIIENERESELFFKIGFSLNDITNVYLVQSLFFITGATLITVFSLLISEVITEIYIQKSFGILTYKISLNFSPIYLIFCFCLCFLFLCTIFVRKYFKRKYDF